MILECGPSKGVDWYSFSLSQILISQSYQGERQFDATKHYFEKDLLLRVELCPFWVPRLHFIDSELRNFPLDKGDQLLQKDAVAVVGEVKSIREKLSQNLTWWHPSAPWHGHRTAPGPYSIPLGP